MPRHGPFMGWQCYCSCTSCRAGWSARLGLGSPMLSRSYDRRDAARMTEGNAKRRFLMSVKKIIVDGLALASLVLANGIATAAGQYGPGVTDTEIKIGNTNPYSGPASAYGINGKVHAAYFAMINEKGGINGRKINYITRDDSYSPPKT